MCVRANRAPRSFLTRGRAAAGRPPSTPSPTWATPIASSTTSTASRVCARLRPSHHPGSHLDPAGPESRRPRPQRLVVARARRAVSCNSAILQNGFAGPGGGRSGQAPPSSRSLSFSLSLPLSDNPHDLLFWRIHAAPSFAPLRPLWPDSLARLCSGLGPGARHGNGKSPFWFPDTRPGWAKKYAHA